MLDALLTPIDNYCERTGPEFWSEPINALTNLAFIIAGLWGLREASRLQAGRAPEVLAWWVVAIGVGSALFHTFANRLTVWLDVLPIAVFTLTYTLFAIRHYLGFAWGPAIAIFVAFYALAGALTALVPDWLRLATSGSTGYLPAFLALAIFGLWVAARTSGRALPDRGGGGLRRVGDVPVARRPPLRRDADRHAFPLAHAQRGHARPAAGGGRPTWFGPRRGAGRRPIHGMNAGET